MMTAQHRDPAGDGDPAHRAPAADPEPLEQVDPPPVLPRSILVVDVEGFGDRRRAIPHQVTVRDGLYRALRHAFNTAGVPWADCYHEDRGDGIIVLIPPQIPKASFVTSISPALASAVREHNDSHSVQEQIRLRMALHAGEVAFDKHGVTASSVNLAFRLLDAAVLKAALTESPGVLALITSDWFFDEVVRHCQQPDPATFRPVRVTVKETSTVAWISLPDHPYPPDPSHLTAPPSQLPTGPVPRQLPAAPGSFTGRTNELVTLTAALDKRAGRGGPVVITAIGGAGGIGKTWLALHWAHRYADRFPDGHLFVDLCGFTPTGETMTPARAVRGFLDALGVDSGRLPAELDARAALYRSLVAGRRMLILLDNARDADQVIPLLPGSPTCTVIITSRNRLTHLINTHSAQPLPVDVLTDTEARHLLAARLGSDRLTAEPDAVTDLLACCAGFPLALSIVAGRAQTHPNFSLADLAAELRVATTRLDALDEDDPVTGISALLSWSYTALPADQARMFGLLGIAPGPDISLPTAANLTNLPIPQTRALLRGLEHAHLLQEHIPSRYRMHDLIKLYATTRAHRDLPDTERTQALRRLVSFYLHTAHTAERFLNPHRQLIQLDPPGPTHQPHPLPDHAAALAWLDAEHSCLLATQNLAADQGWHRTVWQLAWTLTTFHLRRGHWHDTLAAWQTALTAAQHLGDPATLTQAHRHLSHAYTRTSRHADALDHLDHALTLAQNTGDLPAQAHTHHALARAWEQQGEDQRALEHVTRALHLYQTLDQPVWEAEALNAVGWYSARLGDYQQARTHCQAALTLSRSHHDRDGEAATLNSLGYLAHLTGHHDQALGYYQQSLTLYRDLGTTYLEADTLDRLGQIHTALGNHGQARHAWQHTLRLYQDQHRVEDAERIQHQLDTLVEPEQNLSTVPEQHE